MDKDEWGTPEDFFEELDKEFDFNLDPCANLKRKLKPDKILSLPKSIDGLQASWEGMSVYVNPPYSGNSIEKWIRKCYEERQRAKFIVLLIPVTRTGTKYFHECVIPHAEIRFIKGRIKFVPLAGQKTSSNPLYSMLCIW